MANETHAVKDNYVNDMIVHERLEEHRRARTARALAEALERAGLEDFELYGVAFTYFGRCGHG